PRCAAGFKLSWYSFRARRGLQSFPTRRSSDLLLQRDERDRDVRPDGHVHDPAGVGIEARGDIEREDRCARTVQRVDRLGERAFEDRKSTRLNSSHVKISYAVFCLKKKNVRRRA